MAAETTPEALILRYQKAVDALTEAVNNGTGADVAAAEYEQDNAEIALRLFVPLPAPPPQETTWECAGATYRDKAPAPPPQKTRCSGFDCARGGECPKCDAPPRESDKEKNDGR